MGQGLEWRGSLFLNIDTLLTNIQVSSNHNENITLDKYIFQLAYDDDFDMGKIGQKNSQRKRDISKEIPHFTKHWPNYTKKSSTLGEFALDDESDAEMPGLKVQLDLRRIVSYFIVQVKQISSCVQKRMNTRQNLTKLPRVAKRENMSFDRKLLCSCTSHLASLSSPPISLSSCRPTVSSPGVEFR